MLTEKPGLYEGLYLYTIKQRIDILRRESRSSCVYWFVWVFTLQQIPMLFVDRTRHLSVGIGALAVTVPVLILLTFRGRLITHIAGKLKERLSGIIRSEPELRDLTTVGNDWEKYLKSLKHADKYPSFDTRHSWLHRNYEKYCRSSGIKAHPPVWPIVVVLIIAASFPWIITLLDTTLGIYPGLTEFITDSEGLATALMVLWMVTVIGCIDVIVTANRLRYLAVLEVYAELIAEEDCDNDGGDDEFPHAPRWA